METVLLDTNVLIQFEDNKCLSEDDAELLRNVSGKVKFFFHPIQYDDVKKDDDCHRRALLESRIRRYEKLDAKSIYDKEYFKKLKLKTSGNNDLIDNNLIDCVIKNKVNYLITNDKDILKKAKKLNLSNRIFIPSKLFLKYPVVESVNLCCVNDTECFNVDVNDSFFDSLKKDYEGFVDWLETKCKCSHRKCWLIEDNNKIQALCIYDTRSSRAITDEGFCPKCKMLKLCTFKVADYARGTKMGERLLYSAFEYSRKNGIGYIYLTLFKDKQKVLVDLLEEFGFEEIGKKGNESVFGKHTICNNEKDSNLDKYNYDIKYFSSYKDGKDVRKFLIPIQPQFHKKLFPDCVDQQMSLFYTSESFTIKKSYLCKSKITKISPGDLVLFYRSNDFQSVQVIGFVDSVKRLDKIDDIVETVKKRTVYTEEEILNLLNDNKNLLVLNFNLLNYSKHGINLKRLKQFGIAHPQTIIEISDSKYKKIMEEWNV